MSPPAASNSIAPHVIGPVRSLLRAEGLALFALGVLAYARSGQGWGLFAVLILVPDLSLAAYLIGPRAGAIAYNMMHSLAGPLGLAALGILGAVPGALPIAFIWAAHVGFDRALGFGLKYPSAFGDTHLGRIGRQPQAAPSAAVV